MQVEEYLAFTRKARHHKIQNLAKIDILQKLLKEIETCDETCPAMSTVDILCALHDHRITTDDAEFLLEGKYVPDPIHSGNFVHSGITELFSDIDEAFNSKSNMPAFRTRAEWTLQWSFDTDVVLSSIEIVTIGSCTANVLVFGGEEGEMFLLTKYRHPQKKLFLSDSHTTFQLVVSDWSCDEERHWIQSIKFNVV